MKHLTLEDREIIEQMLGSLKSFSATAERLGKANPLFYEKLESAQFEAINPHRTELRIAVSIDMIAVRIISARMICLHVPVL